MKKTIYLFATAALIGLAACNDANTYTVKGNIANAQDGDSIFLKLHSPDEGFSTLNGTVVKDGQFQFKGTQDSAINCYITYQSGEQQQMMDLFLENGKIDVVMGISAKGTPNNEIYQAFREQLLERQKKMSKLYESAMDQKLTDAQRTLILKEVEAVNDEIIALAQETVEKNITNQVGRSLLEQIGLELEAPKAKELLDKLPAHYKAQDEILYLQRQVEKKLATATGQKFVDLEMLSPEGKTVKLSDYAGKGKVVLVDFWASWCGPCRKDMPEVVALYNNYKGKGLEIVGVSLDQKDQDWKAAIKEMQMTWPQMSDLQQWNSESVKLYAISSIPHTMLIDKDGTILARGLRGQALRAKVSELLDK